MFIFEGGTLYMTEKIFKDVNAKTNCPQKPTSGSTTVTVASVLLEIDPLFPWSWSTTASCSRYWSCKSQTRGGKSSFFRRYGEKENALYLSLVLLEIPSWKGCIFFTFKIVGTFFPPEMVVDRGANDSARKQLLAPSWPPSS